MGYKRGGKVKHPINKNQPLQAGQQTLGLIRGELTAMLRLIPQATSALGQR